MIDRAKRLLVVLRAIYREARAENLTFMAGSIAYHAFVSFVPFLVVLFLLVSLAGESSLSRGIVELTGPYLSAATRRQLVSILRNAANSSGLTVVGIATLVWGMMKIFRSLDTAFSNIYESEAANTFLDQMLDGSIVLLTVGLAVLGATLLDGLFASAGIPLAGELKTVVQILGLSAAFFPMFYLFPDEDVSAREVLPGVAFAAVGWTTLDYLFGIYTDLAGQTETYGIIGAVLVIITWFYFSGLVVLLGAAINAVLAGRSTDVADLGWTLEGGEGPDDADWEGLTDGLDALAAADADEWTVTADGETVTLPAPTTVEAEAEDARRPESLGGWTGDARLTLRWDARSLLGSVQAGVAEVDVDEVRKELREAEVSGAVADAVPGRTADANESPGGEEPADPAGRTTDQEQGDG